MSNVVRNFLLLLRREYLDTVKTKAFWLSLLLVPIIVVVMTVGAVIILSIEDKKRYVVIDRTEGEIVSSLVRERILHEDVDHFLSAVSGGTPIMVPMSIVDIVTRVEESGERSDITSAVVAALLSTQPRSDVALSASEASDARELATWWQSNYKTFVEPVNEQISTHSFEELALDGATVGDLQSKLAREEIDAFIVIGEDLVQTSEGLEFHTPSVTQTGVRGFYRDRLREVLRELRIEARGLSGEDYAFVSQPLSFEMTQTFRTGEVVKVSTKEKIAPYVPAAFTYIMFFVVVVGSGQLVNATLDVKNLKVVEVLLSTMSPTSVMYGKIASALLIILTVLGFWSMVLVVPALVLQAAIEFDMSEVFDVVRPIYFVKFTLLSFLGFLIVAPAVTAVGSTVPDIKAAQTLLAPIFMAMAVPMAAIIIVVQSPDSVVAEVLTWIPIYTSFGLMLRSAAPPTWWVELLAISWLMLWVAGVHYVSRSIFAKSILNEGPAPTYRQLLRLMRN